MRLNFCFTSLFGVGTLFIDSAGHLIAEEKSPFFQEYLTTCQLKNINQPIHFHNACQEKEPSFTEMTILDVHSISKIEGVAERILFGDADVVHFTNISTEKASHLYEMFQHTYSHFIHFPSEGQGTFIASKYPLSQIEVAQFEQENSLHKEVLEFSIHGANIYTARLCSTDPLIQLVDTDDIEETVLLGDLPAALTIVKQQFSPFQTAKKCHFTAEDTFDIIPIRRRERDNDDKSGPYCEGRINYKSGPNGTEWSVSGRAGYEDDRGNYVEGEVSRNNKGETSANAKAGYDKDK
jgi:hypothetical protein